MELQYTQLRHLWRTGDDTLRCQWRTVIKGAAAGVMDLGRADGALTQGAGVYALLDWYNLQGRVTSLLQLGLSRIT